MNRYTRLLARRNAALELIRQLDNHRLLALVGRLNHHDGVALRDSVATWDSLR